MANREWTSTRLRFRPMRQSDDEAIFSGYANDPEVTRYLTWNPHKDIEETRTLLAKWIEEDREKKEIVRFALIRKEDDRLIGAIDVVGMKEDGTPEIGYVLGRAYWGKGYMSEAVDSFVKELFSRGYRSIYACADTRNTASLRVLEKNGFAYIGKRYLDPISPWKEGACWVNEYLLSLSPQEEEAENLL